MPEPDFYLDEFLKELHNPSRVEGFTSEQLSKKYGWSRRHASRRIEEGIANGTLQRVGVIRVPRPSDGSLYPRPVYRTKKKDKK
jgi:hypothetical protein